MNKSVIEKRSEKFIKIMRREGLEALIAISPENVFYSTGAYIITQKNIRDRLAIALFSEKYRPAFIICGIEEKLVKSQTWINDIRSYIEFKDSPIKFLIDSVLEMGLEKSRVGIEMHYLCARDFINLRKDLPDVEFVECKHIFEKVRMIKEPEEIDLLANIASATRKGAEAAFTTCNIGDTEKKLADQMTINLIQQNVDRIEFMVLATGKRTLLSHPTPNQTKLTKGDIVRVDYGGVFSGYLSDLARTVVVGKPNFIQADTYKKLIHIEGELIENLQVGVQACSIYKKWEELFEKNGLHFSTPHIGHGLGIDVHEPPIISPLDKTEFKENMVINLEPLVIHEGFFYHIEDTILITKDGPKILTGADLNDQIPIIN
jgi:Xaa-Pro aminopeptidase